MADSKFINVYGSKIHYLEQGAGDPILFLHGIPASSYLWRNIIPELSKMAYCVAPDLIGMGESDKPDISYNISDHIKYINGFIEALGLKKITLVLHGMGSMIGFNYAMQHPDNINGIVFYESYIGDLSDWKKFSLPIQHLTEMLKNEIDYQHVAYDEKLIDRIFNSASLRKLSKEELAVYAKPFAKPEHRKPLIQHLKEAPFADVNSSTVQLIADYTRFLENSMFPKLMIYTIPGFITPMATVDWCRHHLNNFKLVDLGEGLHFVPEYNPQAFSQAIANWYSTAVKKQQSIGC